MNPDKLFDYLDGRLSTADRAAMEKQLISDPQLQRELAVAREIHARMRGDSREVFMPAETDVTERGRKMALRLGAAFIMLTAVNVGLGLWLIFRHETKNPNRALLETQMRQQIRKALEQTATTLTPAPLGVSEITLPAETGKLESIAEQVVAIATQLGGSAAKGFPEKHRLSVVVDLPANRESDFRAAIASIGGRPQGSLSPSTATRPGSPASAEATAEKPTSPTATTPATTSEKKSFLVHVVEQSATSD